MITTNIQFLDQKIRIITDKDPRIKEQFKIIEDSEPVELILKYLRMSEKEKRFAMQNSKYVFEEPFNELTYKSKKILQHTLRMLIAYSVDFKSPTYNSIHGSGFITETDLGKKGILLIGQGLSGKNTLTEKFPLRKTLDDDVLIIDEEKMFVVGKGHETYNNNGGKYLRFTPKPIENAHLNAVFLLDRGQPGGFIKKEEEKEGYSLIPRSFAVFDTLNKELRLRYEMKPPIKVKAPVYKIGTNGNKETTYETIRKTIMER